MNVAMFTNTYAPLVGGIEKSVSVASEDLRTAGHRVVVVTPEFEGATESDDDVFRLPAIKQVYGSPFSLHVPFLDGLSGALEALVPDLIHTHQPFMLGDTGLRFARRRGIPLVYTNHTLYERYSNWVPLPAEHAERLTKVLPVHYANLCDLVLAPTPSVRDLLVSRGVEKRIEVVPTGVETSDYAGGDGDSFRVERGIPRNAFVVGHLGRLVPAKNLDHLAGAVAEYLRGDETAWFLLVGEGESSEVMLRTFEEAGVAARVCRAGMLRGRVTADAYAAMDVFVFASRTDTQGLVLVEAMAAGVPVVALDAPGPKDLVRDGVEGLLLGAETSPGAMADALKRLATEPGLKERLASATPARAAEFDRQSSIARLMFVYEDLLDAWRTQGNRDLNALDKMQEAILAELALLGEKMTIASDTLRAPDGR